MERPTTVTRSAAGQTSSRSTSLTRITNDTDAAAYIAVVTAASAVPACARTRASLV